MGRGTDGARGAILSPPKPPDSLPPKKLDIAHFLLSFCVAATAGDM